MRHEVDRIKEMATVYRIAVTPFRPHDAAAARNGERSARVRQAEQGEVAGDGLNCETEALAIGFFARPLTEPEARLTQCKVCDERPDGCSKFPACGTSLRVEHDRWRNGGRHNSVRQCFQ